MNRLSRIILFLAVTMFAVLANSGVSAQEKNPFAKALESRFDNIDANKDGKISYDEYLGSYEKSIKKSFEKRDRNSDGILTMDEFMCTKKGFGMGEQPTPFQGKGKDTSEQK